MKETIEASPAAPRLLTTRDVATELSTSLDRVVDLIHSGQLSAINISASPDAKRKTWRITPEALQAFLEGRTTQPKPAKPTRKSKGEKYQPVFLK